MDTYRSATSPWSLLDQVANISVQPIPSSKLPRKLQASVPGSKSVSNRALILAALAEGKTELRYLLQSDDTYWCVEGLKQLGCSITNKGSHSDTQFILDGLGGNFLPCKAPIFIGAAGTIGRFLPGALASCNLENEAWTLEPDHSLAKRPVKPLIEALTQLGGRVDYMDQKDHYPLRIYASGLKGGKVKIPGNVSSQYLSGILLSAPYNRNPLEIEVVGGLVQPQYVDITVKMMEDFGVSVQRPSESVFRIEPAKYQGKSYDIEGDASSAGYLFAFAALHGCEVTVSNVGRDSTQPDIKLTHMLEQLGCKVELSPTQTKVIGPYKLKGGITLNLHEISDQTPTLAALAPFCQGGLELRGVAHIRKHECDRISAMRENLERTGIKVEEFEDGLKIHEGQPSTANIKTFSDHRIAMALSLLATKSETMRIENPNCVAKTFPNFFDVLREFGAECEKN